jgi:hypothetical protein
VYSPQPIGFADGSSYDELVFLERSTSRVPGGTTRWQVPGSRDGEWSLEP